MRNSESTYSMSPMLAQNPSINACLGPVKKIEVRFTKFFRPKDDAKGLIKEDNSRKEETKSNSTISDKA